ncbi:MAG TPA: phenylacetate-CoA oxygenase subunit PaaC [Bacteroidia bacterium]|nr:phenylacetate-CoA oxygenase subunit PaaC [Bacteroidia bacterium]
MNLNQNLFNYLLRLSDSGLVLAQRISAWTGHGPFLEEDLALTNIALDQFGRSRSLLEYAGKLEGKNRSEDDLAYFRNEREYFNPLICEQPNGDYAQTMLRQAFVDCFEFLLYSELCHSRDETLAGIAAKSVKEIAYHKRHSFSWVKRFGNGTDESHNRLKQAMDKLWEFTGDMFEQMNGEADLVKAGYAPDLNVLKPKWEKEIAELLQESRIEIPQNAFMQSGSTLARHSENLGPLLAEMQILPRMYPEAKW